VYGEEARVSMNARDAFKQDRSVALTATSVAHVIG
jgi:hypothetical protein